MKKILFVCHGNICRSPMAEFVMKDLVKKAGLASQFYIESAATSREEIGNPVYPPARRKLAEHGISCDGHAARQLTNADYENLRNIRSPDRYGQCEPAEYGTASAAASRPLMVMVPVPLGNRWTRATEDLRRPVPYR